MTASLEIFTHLGEICLYDAISINGKDSCLACEKLQQISKHWDITTTAPFFRKMLQLVPVLIFLLSSSLMRKGSQIQC